MASPTKACLNVTVPDSKVVRCSLLDCAGVLLSCLGLVILTIGIYGMFTDPTEPELRVDSATFSPSLTNATGSELTAAWDLTLRVQNPNNKYSITYEQLEVLVQDGRDFIISTVQLPPFSHPAKNTTAVPVRLRVDGVYVGGGLVPEISEDPARGSLTFGVQVVARTRYSPSPLIGETALWLRYKSVKFVLSGNGGTNTSGGPSKLGE